MDTAWLKSQAGKIAEAATDLGKTAVDMVQDINADVPTKNFEFKDGPLGFRMDGVIVSLVEDGGQAASLGVQVRDQLIAVAGEVLPTVSDDDEEGQKALRKLAKRWIKESPRPVMLEFLPVGMEPNISEVIGSSPADGEFREAVLQGGETVAAASSSGVEPTAAEILAQLKLEGEEEKSIDMVESQPPEGDDHNSFSEVPVEFSATGHHECGDGADVHCATPSPARHTDSVKDLTTRLALVEQASKAAEQRAKAAEVRTKAAEAKAGVLAKELNGVFSAHEAELAMLRDDAREKERAHVAEIAGCQRSFSLQKAEFDTQLECLKEELQDAQRALAAEQARAEAACIDAQAAATEAAAARLEAAEVLEAAKGATPAVPVGDGASRDTAALHQHIDALEQRCASLQQRLAARPVIQSMPGWAQAEGGLNMPPSWEPWLAAVAGKQAAFLAVLVYTVAAVPVDIALRAFTRGLLKRGALLWMFYAQLVVLYAIAASCYAETSAQPLVVGTDLLHSTGMNSQARSAEGVLRGSVSIADAALGT